MARAATNRVSGWELAEQRITEIAKKSSIFVRLEDDGDLVVGAFVGDPRIRECHWVGTEYQDCDGDDCELCARRIRLTAKVMINFYVRDDRMMKVVEGGKAWFANVLKVKNKYGLETRWFEIQRTGAKGDPKTTYTILPDEQLTNADLDEIHAEELHDLYTLGGEDYPTDDDAKPAKPVKPAPTKPPKSNGRETRPMALNVPTVPTVVNEEPTPTSIDEGQLKALVDRLKMLPQETTSAFLTNYGVRRVRDLASRQFKQALGWLESQQSQNQEDPEDPEDPFA